MGMEDETRNFLVLIMHTTALIIIWMMANVLIGIYFKLGLFERTPSLKNYIYYAFFLISLFFLFRHLRRKWQSINLDL